MRSPEKPVEEGIYQSTTPGRYRIKVSAVVKGKREYRGDTFSKHTHISKVRARKHELIAELQKLIEDGGGRAERGLFSGMVQTYWTRAKLSPARRGQCERQYVPFWLTHFGTRTPEWMLQHIPELIAALDTIKRLHDDKPISAGTKDHYVAALSNIFTVVFGEDAPNPGKKIPVFAETDPTKLPRRDQNYFLIDHILAQLQDTWKGEVCRGKIWLRCLAYGGVTFAQLEKMGRDDFYPRLREIIPAHREKGEGAATHRRKLLDEGYEAFVAFDRAEQWGTTQPNVENTFEGALQRALTHLQAHPELIPDEVRIDWKRAAKMTPYDLRHSFASFVLAKTGSRAVAAQYLGHASERQIGRYTQGVISDQLEAAGAVLADAFRARPKLVLVPQTPRRRRRAA
jgi:integrase